ncbi:hypothetical protein Sjap_013269 [Stephania japonica]|uniref:Uncharacterized protein n=1 Tax=Stephania japonica TaxID=461633 RepID=A0AAP0NXH8_9MAGN
MVFNHPISCDGNNPQTSQILSKNLNFPALIFGFIKACKMKHKKNGIYSGVSIRCVHLISNN